MLFQMVNTCNKWQLQNSKSYCLLHIQHWCFYFEWRHSPSRAQAVSLLRYLDHTQLDTHTHTHTHTHISTPLKEWSVRRRDCYTPHIKPKRGKSMLSRGFELAISAIKRLQTNTLACKTTGFSNHTLSVTFYYTRLISNKELMKRWQSIRDFVVKVLWQKRDIAWGNLQARRNAICILTSCCFCC